jgi:hypothetical protein
VCARERAGGGAGSDRQDVGPVALILLFTGKMQVYELIWTPKVTIGEFSVLM